MGELDNYKVGDKFTAYNGKEYDMTRILKNVMEQFEKETGKNAFWHGKETGEFVSWRGKQNIKKLKEEITELTKENDKLKEERVEFKEKLTQFLLSIKLFIE